MIGASEIEICTQDIGRVHASSYHPHRAAVLSTPRSACIGPPGCIQEREGTGVTQNNLLHGPLNVTHDETRAKIQEDCCVVQKEHTCAHSCFHPALFLSSIPNPRPTNTRDILYSHACTAGVPCPLFTHEKVRLDLFPSPDSRSGIATACLAARFCHTKATRYAHATQRQICCNLHGKHEPFLGMPLSRYLSTQLSGLAGQLFLLSKHLGGHQRSCVSSAALDVAA
jgi:hypothetical protein